MVLLVTFDVAADIAVVVADIVVAVVSALMYHDELKNVVVYRFAVEMVQTVEVYHALALFQ